MKYQLMSHVLILGSFLGAFSAEARQYQCSFGNPAFEMTISTNNRRVTKSSISGDLVFKIRQVKRVTLLGETREVFFLDNGDDVQVSLTDSFKDSASGFHYPYAVTFAGMRGGCESEDNEFGNYIARNKSLTNSIGEAVVNSWPGELGAFQGFKVTKNVILPSGTTWKKLSAFGRDDRVCTLKKGSRFVPVAKARGESYVHLFRPQKLVAKVKSGLSEDDFSYLPGEQVISIADESDGFCLVEKDGIRYDVICKKLQSKEFSRVETEVDPSGGVDENVAAPKAGDYVYAKCAEGHSTWIPVSIMKMDSKHFRGTAIRPM